MCTVQKSKLPTNVVFLTFTYFLFVSCVCMYVCAHVQVCVRRSTCRSQLLSSTLCVPDLRSSGSQQEVSSTELYCYCPTARLLGWNIPLLFLDALFFFLLRKQPKYTVNFRKMNCGCFSDYFIFSDSEHIVICFPVKCLDLACVLLPKINKLKASLVNLWNTGEAIFLCWRSVLWLRCTFITQCDFLNPDTGKWVNIVCLLL